MSKLLEFFLGSILVAVLTVALMFFSVLQYVLKVGNAAECAWQGSARAWIDSDADGTVDPDEPALADVQMHVADSQLVPVVAEGWTGVTDKDGDVQFNIPLPGCGDTAFEVYADIPPGYRLTTEAGLAVNSDLRQVFGTQRVYYFGFVRDR